MHPSALEALIEKAAEAGAKKALHAVGLQDDDAAADVRDLRGLLDAWRETKATALKTIVRAMTVGFLAAIAGALGWSFVSKQ